MDKLVWLYYTLELSEVKQADCAVSCDELTNLFERPQFLVLHGGPEAPVGCIDPVYAREWRRIKRTGLAPEVKEIKRIWREVQVPLLPESEIWRYLDSRWYPFTLNGLKILSQLLFYIRPKDTRPLLVVEGHLGMVAMQYDKYYWKDKDYKPFSEDLKDYWIRKCRAILGERALIRGQEYRLYFCNAKELFQCSIVYEVSPFEAEWTLIDVSTSVPRRLWKGFGVRDDWCDWCFCFDEKDTSWLIKCIQRFCAQKRISLVQSRDWSPTIEFDSLDRELFPISNEAENNEDRQA